MLLFALCCAYYIKETNVWNFGTKITAVQTSMKLNIQPHTPSWNTELIKSFLCAIKELSYGWHYRKLEGHNRSVEWRKTTAVCDITAPYCSNIWPYRLQIHQILSVGFPTGYRLCGVEPRTRQCKICHI